MPPTSLTPPGASLLPDLPIGRPRERQGFAIADDGTPLYYRVHEPREGVTAGLPVCFTDGIGCEGYVWRYLEPELVRDRPIVHWQYRGHGHTPQPRDPARVTIADCADDLVAVLDTAGIDRAVLAGHSMGVQVCLETYRRHPERVAALVLLCGSYGHPLRTFKGRSTLEQVLPYVRFAIHGVPRVITAFWRAAVPTDLAYHLATILEINGARIRREDFLPYLQHMGSIDVRLFVDMLAAAGEHSAEDLLPAITVPTLIVAGDRDGFTPRELSEAMAQRIPGAELLVVKDASHTAPIERPGLVNERVAGFVRRHFPPPAE